MKKIRFERVSIAKELREFNVYSPYDGLSKAKEREKIRRTVKYKKLGFEKWSILVDKKIAQYERTLKYGCTKVQKFTWKIIGSDGRTIGRFDSLEQAKKYCMKNNLDYGYF